MHATKMAGASLRTAFAFCEGIGLEIDWQHGASGFLPGINIVDGRLLVDPTAPASTLLHEAGHLACMPADIRRLATGSLKKAWHAISEAMAATAPQDMNAPYPRALMQCSDPEATAWAWAAGIACGLAPEAIIMDHEYDGEGAEMRFALQLNSYLGINGFRHAGLCALPRRGNGMGYPQMLKWLQDAERPGSASALKSEGC